MNLHAIRSDIFHFVWYTYVTCTVFLSSADYANILISANDILRSRNSRGGVRCFLNLGFLKPSVPSVHIPDNDVLIKAKNWVKLSAHRPRIENSTNSDVGKKLFWRSRHQNWDNRKLKCVFVTWVSYQNCIRERTAHTTIITEKPTVGQRAMSVSGLYINRMSMTVCTSAHH